MSKPFTEMLVSLDGYILLPRVDGKFNVFQHSIDTIINQDAVTVEVPDRGEDISLLFMDRLELLLGNPVCCSMYGCSFMGNF